MYSRLGRYEDAIKCYEKSAKINPDDEIWIYIAYALSELGLNEQAQNYFDKLDYADGFNVRAHVLFELGKYDDAINQANSALKINPFMFTSFLMIANSLSKLGKYQESIPWYDKYIEKIKSSSRKSYGDLVFYPKGIALYKLGRKDEAVKCWKKSKEAILWIIVKDCVFAKYYDVLRSLLEKPGMRKCLVYLLQTLPDLQ